MSDPQQPFSPYDNIMPGMDYVQRRYAPDEYERRQTLTSEQVDAEIAERRRVRDAERAAERDKVEAAHCAVGARGLRRAVLELHRPVFEQLSSRPGCSCCYDSEWGPVDWPCETYVLARGYPEDK